MIDSIVTVGEALAIFRTTAGQPLWLAGEVTVATGGAEANVAMAIAREGIHSAWYGRIGDDELGRRIVHELRGEGVDVHATIDADASTGMLVKSLHPGGRTSVSYYRAGSAGSRMSLADVERIRLNESTLVHVCGITPGLSPSAHEAIFELLDRIADAGAMLSFDVNHRDKVWRNNSPHAVYGAIAARADIVFASLQELRFLVSDEPASSLEQGARVLVGAGYSHVVITDGPAGAIAAVDGLLEQVAAVPVDVVDTVGAGDAFVAGYLSEFVRGHTIGEALAHGALLGAAACRHPGDWEGAADWRDLAASSPDPVER